MFGYLQIQKSELLVREYEAYKAVYCGLCKQIGRDYSFITRTILSYDCTFYAMLLMSLHSACSGFEDGRCTFNPLKKCKFAVNTADDYSKAAAFSVISAYYKIIDDIIDSGFFKSLAFRIVKPFFSHWRKKAVKSYPEIDACLCEMTDLQQAAQQDKNCSVDKAAHPTAQMLGKIFSLEAKDENENRVLYQFGYQIGRWIYLIDAADDMAKDIKHKNFNPFVNSDTMQKTETDYIALILNQSLARAYEAYNLIDIKDFKGILDNMMLMGFPAVQNRVTQRLKTEVINE